MKTNSFIVLVIGIVGIFLLIAGCSSKTSEPKPLPVSGEAVSDSTIELDSGLQEVDDLNQLDQEAQNDISFEELEDIDLS